MNTPEVDVQGEVIDSSTEGNLFDGSVRLLHFQYNISCTIALSFDK
jgi:hypothetical protein